MCAAVVTGGCEGCMSFLDELAEQETLLVAEKFKEGEDDDCES